MELWRISNHQDLTGEGGRRSPARWHSGGHPIVYLAASPPGALIEVLAHLEISPATLPSFYTLLRISAPDATKPLPLEVQQTKQWTLDLASSRRIGDAWLSSRQSVLARVPSAIMPLTFNYLLNPLHPQASKIRIEESRKALYDERLIRQPAR